MTQASGRFFEKKRHQKTFGPGPRVLKPPRSEGAKVFCGAFFQKSDRFLASFLFPSSRD
jgi:hypothetical protein